MAPDCFIRLEDETLFCADIEGGIAEVAYAGFTHTVESGLV